MNRAPVPPQTLKQWIEVHGGRVRAIAEAFACGAVQAEDIFQETFVRAWRKGAFLLAGGEEHDVGAWLCKVASNVGRSALETAQRRERLLRRWALSDTGAPPWRRTIQQELYLRRVWQAVAALPDRQRSVLLRRIVAGASTKDVAKEMGIAEGTVRATLRDALSSLRRELPELDQESVRAGLGLVPEQPASYASRRFGRIA